MVWEADNWWHPSGRPPDYMKGQIGGIVLINFATGADLTISR